MPRPKTGGRSYGGNHSRGYGTALTGKAYDRVNGVSQVRPVYVHGAPSDSPKETCPSCGVDVPVKSDGDLRSHRVGRGKRDSWPCPGRHAAPRS